MKTIRTSLILLMLCLSTVTHSQETDILYHYELISTGQTIGIDTVYQAFLMVDSTDANAFKKLVVLNDQHEKVITIKTKDLEKDPSITISEELYKIDVGEWTHVNEWLVFGEKEDLSKKYFKHKDKVKKRKVIHTAIPIDYSKRKDPDSND